MRWLDVLLLLVAAALVASGPVMAWQEASAVAEAKALEAKERTRQEFLGERGPTPEQIVRTGHRDIWRALLPPGVLLIGALGTFTLVRVHRKPALRGFARRPGLVMIAGLTMLDLTYFIDWAFTFDAHPFWRVASVIWLYPLSGILIIGSLRQLALVEDTFAPILARKEDDIMASARVP